MPRSEYQERLKERLIALLGEINSAVGMSAGSCYAFVRGELEWHAVTLVSVRAALTGLCRAGKATRRKPDNHSEFLYSLPVAKEESNALVITLSDTPGILREELRLAMKARGVIFDHGRGVTSDEIEETYREIAKWLARALFANARDKEG
jgi:hypothetical protein